MKMQGEDRVIPFLLLALLFSATVCTAESLSLPYADTLKTTNKNLFYYGFGQIGSDHPGLALDIPGDCDSDMVNVGSDMYLYCASALISRNDGEFSRAYASMFTQWWEEDWTFMPTSGIWDLNGPDYNCQVCSLCTTDSLFGITMTLWGPTDGNDFVIGRFDFYLINPADDFEDVHLGMILDWDVPSDDGADNSSGILNTHPLTFYQRGVQTITIDEEAPHDCPIPEDQRYAAILVLSGSVEAMWTAENAPMQYGSGLHPDSLYNRMTTPGFDIYSAPGADSVCDLHTGLCVKTVDMTGQTTHSFVIAMATSNAGQDDLVTQMNMANQWAIDRGIVEPFCECISGDVNGDYGPPSVGDAVYIVSYVFKGGPDPFPYDPCSGDANGDCVCNIGDAVYIINYVFAGGPKPPKCEQWIDECGSYEY